MMTAGGRGGGLGGGGGFDWALAGATALATRSAMRMARKEVMTRSKRCCDMKYVSNASRCKKGTSRALDPAVGKKLRFIKVRRVVFRGGRGP
jgi:hypothetical protein